VEHDWCGSEVTETSMWHHDVVRQAPCCQRNERAQAYNHGPCQWLMMRGWAGHFSMQGDKLKRFHVLTGLDDLCLVQVTMVGGQPMTF
jgi:hypothetical protein